MKFVFSTEINGKSRWYKKLDSLPVYSKDVKVKYFIHPVFSSSDENLNLLCEEFGIIKKNNQYYWKPFYPNGLFMKYLKALEGKKERDNVEEVDELEEVEEFYVYGYGNTATLFSNIEAFVEYNLITKSLNKVEFS
jgi:pyruvate-formate lyase-activating enzyme